MKKKVNKIDEIKNGVDGVSANTGRIIDSIVGTNFILTVGMIVLIITCMTTCSRITMQKEQQKPEYIVEGCVQEIRGDYGLVIGGRLYRNVYGSDIDEVKVGDFIGLKEDGWSNKRVDVLKVREIINATCDK